jgi:two-component system, OmpR family, phosphate regulon sensor histidine kinase PhoR
MSSLRKRRSLHLPITLSVLLMGLNVVLMVCWIVLLANFESWGPLTIGTVAFALILVVSGLYLFLTIKEVRLNQRQANFVDSVTHELKTPIASLRLYLDTLRMRHLDSRQQEEFYNVMDSELVRLDHLINQLLEVARLDAIGQEAEPEDIELEPLLRRCAEAACRHHKRQLADVFKFAIEPAVIHARRLPLEMIFGNLIDNAVKYGAAEPRVGVSVQVTNRERVVTRITDNGEGVPPNLRGKIFKIFYRGGSELERRQKGTGVGLYIVRTLVGLVKGKVRVLDQQPEPGSVFEVELPGRAIVGETLEVPSSGAVRSESAPAA